MTLELSASRKLGLLSAAAISTSLSAWAGCSAGAGGPTPGGPAGGGSGGTGATGAGAAMTSTGAVGTGGEFINIGGGQSTGASTGLPDGACGATTLVAETAFETHIETRIEEVTRVTPAALYIMLDQSGSMFLLWPAATQSLITFVNDSASDGLHVGLQYFAQFFPNDCSGSGYSVPDVPWGVLGPPGTHNQAIVDSINAHGPIGAGTPIEDALRGVIQGCQDYEAANPTIPCFGLLVTDGDPSNCSAKGSGVYPQIAADGAAAGVPVYTVGMQGADNAFLDTIAQAAGTDCNGADPGLTCDAGEGAQFLDALNSVRETVTDTITYEEEVQVEVKEPLDCEWLVPTGEDTDLDKMTVKFTDQATGVETELGRVLDPADCADAGRDAWHYDSEDAPTKLVACPSTCDRIKNADAKIDILAGCDVEIIIPR